MTYGHMTLFSPKSVLFICGLIEVMEKLFSLHQEKSFAGFFIWLKLSLKQPFALPI